MTDALQGASLALRARLGEMDGCWLYVACGCGRSSSTPFRLLIERHGRSPHLGAILSRLKCRGCQARPVAASLNERGDTNAHGGARSWSIPLLP